MNIIISFTSWPERILMAQERIKEMLAQTLQPYSIELNLALEDFPNREYDLPDSFVHIIENNPTVHINWCERNNKVFLKLLPVVHKYIHQNVLIATLDDDIAYSKDYLVNLYEGFINHHCDKFTLHEWPDNGGMEIYRCLAFNEDVFEYLTPAIIANQIDDVFYRLYLEKNGKVCKHNKGNIEQLVTILPKTTRGICDLYAPNGNRDWQYINNAIAEMKKSLGIV